MFGTQIGVSEVLLLLIIALILFGPRRLPELGRSIGKTLRLFRDASEDLKRSLEDEIYGDESTEPPSQPEEND